MQDPQDEVNVQIGDRLCIAVHIKHLSGNVVDICPDGPWGEADHDETDKELDEGHRFGELVTAHLVQEAVANCVVDGVVGAKTARDTAHFWIEADVCEQVVVEQRKENYDHAYADQDLRKQRTLSFHCLWT